MACPYASREGVSHDELMVPALATAAFSEASSMEGLEPREDLKELTRLWQAPLLPASPKASLTQSAHLRKAQVHASNHNQEHPHTIRRQNFIEGVAASVP